MKNSIFIFIILCSIVFACNKEPIGQTPIDNVSPGPVSNVKVENIAGGAILSYSLPQDEDLLYIKAVYSLKDGVLSEARSSLYTDTLKVVGFGDTQERQVSVIAVDRSRNESSKIVVTINPLEPVVNVISTTSYIIADFGGIHAYWDNPSRSEVSVVLLLKDNNNEYVPVETVYSTMVRGEGTHRDMDTIPSEFGIYIQDRWENRSETKYFSLTPLYETKFDRTKFRPVYLPNDEPTAWGWVLPNIYDGIIGDQGFHTAIGTGRWPQSFTLDLGVPGLISRMVEYQRQGSWIYSAGNIKEFQLWGSLTLDATGDWGSWTKLIDCVSIKPSGIPMGKNSAEDNAWASAGEEFIASPLNIPKVRYVRVLVTKNWAGTDFMHISELEFYGDNR